MTMQLSTFATKHHRVLLLGAAVLILYLWWTRKTTKVVAVVDASGSGMVLEDDTMAERSKTWGI